MVVLGAWEVEARWLLISGDTQVSHMRASSLQLTCSPALFQIKKKILTQMNFLHEINFLESPEVIFNN